MRQLGDGSATVQRQIGKPFATLIWGRRVKTSSGAWPDNPVREPTVAIAARRASVSSRDERSRRNVGRCRRGVAWGEAVHRGRRPPGAGADQVLADDGRGQG